MAPRQGGTRRFGSGLTVSELPCRERMTVSPASVTVSLAAAILHDKVTHLASEADCDGIEWCKRCVATVLEGRVTVSMAHEPSGAPPPRNDCVRPFRASRADLQRTITLADSHAEGRRPLALVGRASARWCRCGITSAASSACRPRPGAGVSAAFLRRAEIGCRKAARLQHPISAPRTRLPGPDRWRTTAPRRLGHLRCGAGPRRAVGVGRLWPGLQTPA